MCFPAGLQTITPYAGGVDAPIQVMVDKAGMIALEKQRVALTAKGKRPYFDAEHADDGATFWPDEFFWKDGDKPGIYARGSYTSKGIDGVEGRVWRTFSPVFHVDNKYGTPARIICNVNAKPNMGGLVNDAAFYNISPLWAKNATGAQSGNLPNKTYTNMDPAKLTALQEKNTELQNELDALKAKDAANKAKSVTDDIVTARIEAKEAQLKANAAELESAALKAKNTSLEQADMARREADADAAIAAAIQRGAIAAKDEDGKKQWKSLLVADPANTALLAKLGSNPALGVRITQPAASITSTHPSANHVMKSYAEIVAKNSKIPMNAANCEQKGELARAAAAIFAKDIAKDDVLTGMSINDAIQAADNSDASAGLLSGTLVLQRCLPLMKFQFPILGSISQDFSDSPGKFNQTESSRIVLSLATEDYDSTLDANGRPKGFVNSIPGQAIDVPITLDSYFGIPIIFSQAQIGATVRNLFAEQAPMAGYAIATKLVSKLTALMTAANFNAYKGNSDTGGATTNNSTTVVVTDSSLNYPGQFISGSGIPANAFVKSITDSTHIVISAKATATASGVTLTFGTGKVPTAYTTYVKSLQDFGSGALADLRAALTTNEVPPGDRFALLNASYYAKLGQDPTLNSFFAAYQSPEIVTEGRLPKVQGFQPLEAPYFPTANYGVGFVGHKASLCLKTRLPQDFTQASPSGLPGSVTTITDPDTGISILLVQRVDLVGNYAEYRPELMAGAAVGERRAGLLLTSQ